MASAPVTVPGTEDREPYAVRARFASVLPLAASFLAWDGVLGTTWAIGTIHEYSHALVPLAVVGVGANLILIDLPIPGMALTADGAGLRIGREFLAWNEIEAIDVILARNDTELTVGPAGRTRAIGVGKGFPIAAGMPIRRRIVGNVANRSRPCAALIPGRGVRTLHVDIPEVCGEQ